MDDDYDFAPSADHLGIMNAALQYMLLQSGDDAADTIVLFPAWPCDWDVRFKLHATRNTSVEVHYAGGMLTYLHVEPEERAKAIVFYDCVNT